MAASPADKPTPPATAPPTTGTTATAPSAVGLAPTAVPSGPCGDTRLTLRSDRPNYRPGQPVHLTATLVNAGAVTCTIQSRAERGFAVVTGSTTVWSSGCSSTPGGHTAVLPCPQFIALMPVKAGQTLTRTQDWSQQADGTLKQVAAGSYTVGESWGGLRATTIITVG